MKESLLHEGQLRKNEKYKKKFKKQNALGTVSQAAKIRNLVKFCKVCEIAKLPGALLLLPIAILFHVSDLQL